MLRWPHDAFFQWNVRGTRLWANDAEHARVLLRYIESPLRDPARYPGHGPALRRLPAAALAARNREVVARGIRRSLQEAMLPAEPLGEWLDGQGRCWAPQPDGSWRMEATSAGE